MADLLKEAVKAIAFVTQYNKSIKQHPQPTSLIDVAERMVKEIERLQAIANRPLNDDLNVLLNRCENQEPLSLAEQRELYEWLQERDVTISDYGEDVKRLRSDLHEIESEVVEYVHDGREFNWTEAVIAIRHWREVAEAADAKAN